jgi:DNA-binding transcriptional ArsR family regulator
MISYRLGVDDLADMRFACSPLLETATSLWALYEPSAHVLHLPWIRQTRSLLQDWPDRELLMSLVAPRVQWLPDFLTPRPTSPLPDIDDELRRVRSTPPHRAVADVRNAYSGQPLPTELERLCARPRQLRDRLADVITTYWSTAVEPHWPRMRAVLEADMVHRARLLARDGAAAVLTGLDPSAQWSDGVLRLRVSSYELDYDAEVRGRGFWLVPTLFAKHAISPVGGDEPPTVAYPARGIGTLWEQPRPTAPGALDSLIGPARAALLIALASPASTLELARQRQVTPGAISQQLAALLANGLVSKARAGRVVLYTRTELADQLIGNRP